jgi:hypothetical protein
MHDDPLQVGVMKRLQEARLWLLLRLLAEDPYAQARTRPRGDPHTWTMR